MGKAKGKMKKGTRPAAAQPRQEKPNLFEMMFNKKKFDVLGKKQKGEKRKSGKARSEGLEKVSLALSLSCKASPSSVQSS